MISRTSLITGIKWTNSDAYDNAKKRITDYYGGKDWCRCISTDHESDTMRCSSVSCDFPASDPQLEQYLSANGLTLNELCIMAALHTLHEHEKKDDIMVSWAYSGRDDVTYKDTVFALTKEFPVAVSFDKITCNADLISQVKEQIQLGVACQLYPYVSGTTQIEINNPFRVRTLGSMRQFKGIEGVPCQIIPLPDKNAVCGLMNIQILAKKDGGQELRLTYSNTKYEKQTAENVLDVFCRSLKKLMDPN